MKCSKCGEDVPDNSSFCKNCGNPVNITCPNCGSENISDAKYCKSCGTVLNEESQSNTNTSSIPSNTKKSNNKIIFGIIGIVGLCIICLIAFGVFTSDSNIDYAGTLTYSNENFTFQYPEDCTVYYNSEGNSYFIADSNNKSLALIGVMDDAGNSNVWDRDYSDFVSGSNVDKYVNTTFDGKDAVEIMVSNPSNSSESMDMIFIQYDGKLAVIGISNNNSDLSVVKETLHFY